MSHNWGIYLLGFFFPFTSQSINVTKAYTSLLEVMIQINSYNKKQKTYFQIFLGAC